MSEAYEYIKKKNIKAKRIKEFFFNFIILLLCGYGFLGPDFWKVESPHFISYFVKQSSSKVYDDINFIDKLDINKNYLSSNQINNSKIVLEWSNKVLNNIIDEKPIPRMYFPNIPKNMNEYNTHEKKKVFLTILLPIALRGNELVLHERKVMKIAFLNNNIYEIEKIAKKYKVENYKKINFSDLERSHLNKIKTELLLKVNDIPVSMILAQAIIESGWGLSRFAREGNALFGQWTWKTSLGIKPKRSLDANHSVKKFRSISESMNSYILNLNSHPAYKEMRAYRSKVYKAGKKMSGYDTANFLERYAQIGTEYILKITKMIKANKLYKFETARLEN